MSEPPCHWIKQLEEAIELMQEVPLWGHAPEFPWEESARSLQNAWHLSEFQIIEHKAMWRSEQQLLEGLGTNPGLSALSLNPLKGSAILAISAEDRIKLTKAALTESSSSSGLIDKRIQQGFYTYLLLEGINALEKLHPFENLSIVMEKEAELPQTGALCIDIQLRINSYSLFPRLLCSSTLCQAFKKHFAERKPPLSKEIAKSLEIPLRFEIGSTSLSLSKWQNIQTGDLLLLDRCTYDPKIHKGSVEIVFGQTPLFRARIKEGGVKILDYAFYFEEESPMSYDDEDHDEYHLDDDDEEYENENTEEEEQQEEEEEEEEELTTEEQPQEEKPLWEAGPQSESDKIANKLSSNKIPLTITVEVARLNMSVEKLLQLVPGNEIALPVYPEQGVQLLVNGKKIAKGELIKIGETLGVRILHIGD